MVSHPWLPYLILSIYLAYLIFDLSIYLSILSYLILSYLISSIYLSDLI